MRFERLDLTLSQWEERTREFGDRTVFQSSAWLAFLRDTQGGELVLARLLDGNAPIGYFCGLLVRKCGLPILGSPMPGWTTTYMGFNLSNGVERFRALQSLVEFAFRELGCVHLEIMDLRFASADIRATRFESTPFNGFEIDLTQDEDRLLAKMTGPCRTNIRKAVKSGVAVRECWDDSFIDQYYLQLQDVFAKQKLVPTYSKERVRQLLHHLSRAERKMLPLQAIDPEGRCIASMITLGMNDRAYFWGGASWRKFQILRPNELLMWESMKYWKAEGIRAFDMGGAGEYKRKYGGVSISIPWLRTSKYPGLNTLRETAAGIFRLKQRLRGAWNNNPTPEMPTKTTQVA